MQWRNQFFASVTTVNDYHFLEKGKKQSGLSSLKSDCQFKPQILLL